jgi:small-conductance mechanosensitive channel
MSQGTSTKVDDAVVEIFEATRSWLLLLIAVLVGLQMLDLPLHWQERVSHLWFVVLVLQLALWASRAILLLRRKIAQHAAVAQTSASATLMSWGLQTALWTIVLLAVLSNLGVNITAMVTSLGVGGIAVALAVQNVLGDLFASLAIALDKPFEVGDAITANGVSGTVERVGLKTTRIRAPGGEQVVMSNADLLKNAVSNYQRQTTRRIVFKFSVSYGTPAEKAGQIPAIVKAIVEAQPNIRFDRAHLQNMSTSGLDYEVVYIVDTSDYKLYMDTQQRIYLALMEKLQALGGAPATSGSGPVQLVGR